MVPPLASPLQCSCLHRDQITISLCCQPPCPINHLICLLVHIMPNIDSHSRLPTFAPLMHSHIGLFGSVCLSELAPTVVSLQAHYKFSHIVTSSHRLCWEAQLWCLYKAITSSCML